MSFIVYGGGKIFYLCDSVDNCKLKMDLLKKDPDITEVDIYKCGLSFVKQDGEWKDIED